MLLSQSSRALIMSVFLQHVPLSAVLILVLLFWKGLHACWDSELPISRALFGPLAILGWSLWHIATTQTELMLLCWGFAAIVMFSICRSLRYPGGLLLDPASRRVYVRGSPVALILMLMLYAAHFVEGAFRAMHPIAEVPVAVMCGITVVYGGVAGVLLARLFKLAGLIAHEGSSGGVLPR